MDDIRLSARMARTLIGSPPSLTGSAAIAWPATIAAQTRAANRILGIVIFVSGVLKVVRKVGASASAFACGPDDHISSFFSDHHSGCVRVRRGDVRHDRRIRYAQSGDAANAQLRIDHRALVAAHAAGADRMEGRAAGPARVLE